MLFRQNRRVPKYATPASDLPSGVSKAARVFGINLVRLSILRELQTDSEGLTSGDLAKRLDISKQTIIRHIRSLETDGLVYSNTDNRRGDRVQYRVDRGHLAVALDELRHYVLPTR